MAIARTVSSIVSQVVLLLILATGLSVGQDSMTATKAPSSVTVQDLAFISGHSRGEYEGGIADEHWSEPAGDSIMGVSRYMKGGKVQRYQLMVIEQTPKGLALRLMGFKPGLDTWEDKARVESYLLVNWAKGQVEFERADKGARIVYRTAGNGVLECTIERSGKGKELFQYTHSSE
jgi:hypothetical protein